MKKDFMERLSTLIQCISLKFDSDPEGKETSFDMLESGLAALQGYVGVVYQMEVSIPILRERLDTPQEIGERIMELDQRRRTYHNAAVARCASMNRLCEIVGAENLYEGDTEDRNAVAEFCMAAVKEVFSGRTDVHLSELFPEIEFDLQKS